MLNKTLLICFVLAHFHISFATETDDEPTRSCCKLFSFRVMPGEEVLKTKPASQIKGCSLIDIIKSMFRKKANKNILEKIDLGGSKFKELLNIDFYRAGKETKNNKIENFQGYKPTVKISPWI